MPHIDRLGRRYAAFAERLMDGVLPALATQRANSAALWRRGRPACPGEATG